MKKLHLEILKLDTLIIKANLILKVRKKIYMKTNNVKNHERQSFSDDRVVDYRFRKKQYILKYVPQIEWEDTDSRSKTMKIMRDVNLACMFIKPRFINIENKNNLYRPRNPIIYDFPWANEEIVLIDEEPVWIFDSKTLPLLQAIRQFVPDHLHSCGILPKGRIYEFEKFPTVYSEILFKGSEIQNHCRYHQLDWIEGGVYYENKGQYDHSDGLECNYSLPNEILGIDL
jgi:hypothetical protein